jgi:hypothetical protein
MVTLATGDYTRLLELSQPAMERYADRHGYELYRVEGMKEILERAGAFERPPSWWKIPLLDAALGTYDEVLWLDADVMILDDDLDIADETPAEAWQALVRHHTTDGEVPNCGVWLLRWPMRKLLGEVWGMTQYLNHGWWEQAGMLDLLGYRDQPRPVVHLDSTPLYEATHWLPLEWNSHESMDRHPNPRFAHVTAGPVGWRAPIMRRYADQLQPTGG